MLLGNYSVLNKNPGRALGGSTVSDTRPQWSKSGPARGRFLGVEELAFGEKYGTPNGYLHPYSWVMPIKPGGLGSNTFIVGDGALAANLAGGKNAEAALAGTGSITDAALALVVSAAATLAGTGAITDAQIVAVLNAEAALSGSGTAAGTLRAVGELLGALSGVGAVTLVPYATGELSADLTPAAAALTADQVADAVWSTVVGQYTTEGTFGYATAFLYHLAHNRIVTNPADGTFTVYDDDGTTVLYVADIFGDAAGTTPYDGSGVERRDAFG